MPAKKTTKPHHKNGNGKGKDAGLRVRMYHVGFGDFFLLTVPAADGPQHILIDCGVTPGTSHKGDLGTIKDAVADMAQETGNKLALIIMTHRHMDHIIGFSRCADVFKKMQVDAVWMPYWESEYDEQTKNFQAELTSLALDIHRHLTLNADAKDPDVQEMLAMAANATGAGTGGGTNAASLEILKTKLGAKPNYYACGDKAVLPPKLVAAGLTAEILGPPPKETAATFMNLTDLKKGVGQYLDVNGNGNGSSPHAGNFDPFGSAWHVAANQYPPAAFHEYLERKKEAAMPEIGDRGLEDAVNAAQPDLLFTAVKTLDSFLNNQSLVVLFTIAGKKLLFVGDAQAGNWEYWLYGGTPEKAPSIGQMTAEGKSILGNLDFYKVGHHGSTNATPVTAVETMGGNFAAMCSTQEGCYGSEAKGTEVPRAPLLTALAKKSALVRSDDDGQLPPPAQGRYARANGDLYVDYFF